MRFGKRGNYESLDENDNIHSGNLSQYGSNLEEDSDNKANLIKYGIIILVVFIAIFIIILYVRSRSKTIISFPDRVSSNQQQLQVKIDNLTQQQEKKIAQNSSQELNNSNSTDSNSTKSISSNSNSNNKNPTISNSDNSNTPNTTNKIDISELLPKIIKESNTYNISNISELFKSRKLLINNKNITNEYIHCIRPIDEQEEEKYKQVSYQNKKFDNYYKTTKEGQISAKDFYQLCNKSQLIETYNDIPSEKPYISVIIPSYNKNKTIMATLNSVVSQTLKNIEIIIIDDASTDEIEKIYENLLEKDSRIRLFKHERNMGVWRTRIDGFLYSKGKYMLQVDPGDFLADNYILEDLYKLVSNYSLDTLRFTFSKVPYNNDFINNEKFGIKNFYPKKFTKIIYGRPAYNVHMFGYGTIWNRLVRSNIVIKGLNLVDEYILNAHKNLWDDMWLNDLINRVSFSNLIVNRLGYIYLSTKDGIGTPKINDSNEKDKTIREFIYFWLFDYELLKKESKKKVIINKLRNYSKEDNKFYGLPMSLQFLTSNFPIYDHLLNLLINDLYIEEEDRNFVKDLLNKAPKNIA